MQTLMPGSHFTTTVTSKRKPGRTKASIRALSTFAFVIALMVFSFTQTYASQTDIAGPAGGNTFGTGVTVLPNGNIVVTDPNYSFGAAPVGAVHLLDGATLSLISTLRGTLFDFVGDGGITVLTNGNFVVRSLSWDNPTGPAPDAGAVTLCSAVTGCNGVVSSLNSLVGGRANDVVGSGGVTALTNGNFVVSSPRWDNPTGPVADVGAVTRCNGAGGVAGLVASGNSLIGGTANDSVGNAGVTALTNGNYVVRSFGWDNPSGPIAEVGAVTWGNGAGGTVGLVTSGNSLIGGIANDVVGFNGVTALSNGNYVVSSSQWDNPAGPVANVGAATWGNGAGGTVGLITSGNSLIGGTASDFVGSGSVTALTNGNYAVRSFDWNNPAGPFADAGAVTWGNGAGGTVGLVSSSNSLVGGNANDRVGQGGVTALTNGSYVVSSYDWDNLAGPVANVGAVTWGNGAGGTVGLVTSGNSLVGGTANDMVGFNGVTALSNSNYVVSSSQWDNPTGPVVNVGAVTWGNGAGGTVGLVTSGNSLIGGTASDFVGDAGVTALTNGNYVVSSFNWDNPVGPVGNVGAVTWGNGAGGTVGLVSSSNSLVGGTASDGVGQGGVTALTNGNYVVASSAWDNPTGPVANVGAVTWGNGAGGTAGLVTSGNSLIGGTANDLVGNGGLTALTNGHYVVRSNNWDNPEGPVGNARAVTWGNGVAGTVGLVSSANSVVGTVGSGTGAFAFDAARNRLFVGRPASNLVSVLFFTTFAIADGNIDNAATWNAGVVPTALTNVTIPTGRTVTVNIASNIGSLDIAGGATLAMNANLNLGGALTLGTQIDTGANTLGLSCSSDVSGASATNFVLGSVKRDFCSTAGALTRYPTTGTSTNGGGAATGDFTYPVGTTINGDEYSPLAVSITALGNNVPLQTDVSSSITVKVNYGTVPPLNDGFTLDRYWTLTETGDLTANLVFNYLDTDVDGNENNYRIIRVSGGAPLTFPNQCPNSPCVDPAANTGTIDGVFLFSEWTLGEPAAPTAADGNVSGRVVDGDGNPVAGAVVRLSGQQTRKTITDANGRYHFDNVEANRFYTVTPMRVNYNFNPFNRSFNQIGNNTEAGFNASFAGDNANPLDTTEYFVRQQYVDLLGREPDEGGFNYWSDEILRCGSDAHCINARRRDVAAAFFIEQEFQQSGAFIYNLYKGSLGRRPGYGEYTADRRQVVGGPTLEADKLAFADSFVQRPEFVQKYQTNTTSDSFVDALLEQVWESSKVDLAGDRSLLLALYQTGGNTNQSRSLVLQHLITAREFKEAEYNAAFVLTEYFGYLRRNPEPEGYDFWLNVLNNREAGNFRGMVCSFITSTEYQKRFSSVVTHSNAECGR